MTVRGKRMVRDAEGGHPDPHLREVRGAVAGGCGWPTAGRRPEAVGAME